MRGSASLYCSTWTCECPVRKPYSPRARTVRYAPTQSLPILWRGAIPCMGLHGSFRAVIPVVLFGPPRTHCIYPTPFVTAPALLSSFRSIVATAAYHAPSHPSVAFFHSTRCNLRLYPNNPYFRPYICPAFLVRVTYWGVHVDATHAR